MSKKNLLKLLAVVMILAMAMTMLIACGPKEPEPEPEPPYTAKDAASEISTAIVNSLGENVSVDSPIGFDYALAVPTDGGDVTLILKGVLDTKTAEGNKFYFAVNEGDGQLFSLAIDDKYLYFTSADAKKKFEFNLVNYLANGKIPVASHDDIKDGMIGQIPDIVFDLIMNIGKEDSPFEHEVDGDETYNTIYGSLEGVAPLIGSVVDGVIPGAGAKLGEVLAGVKIELATCINADKKIEYADLTFKTADSNVTVSFNSMLANVSDDWAPEFTMPAKDDAEYVDTNLINFVMDGRFQLVNKESYAVNSVATYNYDIAIDLDIFKMLENALYKDEAGKIAFDVKKFFEIEEGNIYINVSHVCGPNCGCSATKPSKGSILTIAYSPLDFANEEIYVSINAGAILPKTLLSNFGVADSIAGTISGLGNKNGILATNINKNVLVDFIVNAVESNSAAAMAGEGAQVSFPDDTNVVSIIGSVLDVLGEIKYTHENGVFVGTDAIADLLYELSGVMGVDVNVANVVKSFFTNNTHVSLSVDNAEYGVENFNDKYNFRDEFNILNRDASTFDGAYKFVENGVPVVAPALSFKPALDAAGNPVFTDNDSAVQTHIVADPYDTTKWKPLPMSPQELETLIEIGAFYYNYVDMNGVKGTQMSSVSYIDGLDMTKFGVEQDVLLHVIPVDAGSIGGLLNVLKGVKLPIPGEIIPSKITLSEITKARFYQKDGTRNMFDPEKTYNYNDPINLEFILELTFGEGEDAVIKEYKVNPTTGIMSKINKVSNFTAKYEMFGFTHEINVKVADTPYSIGYVADKKFYPMDAVHATVQVGTKYKMPSSVAYLADGNAKIETAVINDKSTFTTPEGITVVPEYSSLVPGLLPEGFAGNFVQFDEVGEYTIGVALDGGVKFDVIVNVVDKTYPKYTINKIDMKKNIVTVSKNDLNSNESLVVSMNIMAYTGETVMTTVTGKKLAGNYTLKGKALVYGVDYVVKMNGEELAENKITLSAAPLPVDQLEIVYKTAKPAIIRVTLNAVDYSDQVVSEKASTLTGRIYSFKFMNKADNKNKFVTSNINKDYTLTINDKKCESNLFEFDVLEGFTFVVDIIKPEYEMVSGELKMVDNANTSCVLAYNKFTVA